MMNEKLLKRLMNDYGECILRTCFLYIGDYHLAQDAAQETFWKALKAYPKLNSIENEKAWLTKIAINCCKNIMRTSWFRCVTLDDNLLEKSHTAMEDFIQKQSLAEAIMLLKRNERQLIILYYYQGLSIKEISKILNRKENTISQQIKRVRMKLKCLMEDNNHASK